MTTSWADKVAGGLQRKVANTVRRVDSNNQLERPIITTLFEVEDLQQQLIVQRAAAIAQDILYHGSVLFTFPAADFPDRTTVYSLIQDQIGHINNVRPISKMGTQQRQDLIVEVQFDQADDITKAVTIGVIHKERCYKGTPTNVGTSNTLVKLLLNNVPWSAGLNATDFAHQMVESLGHYGRVCQLRKHTCAGGFFEGEVSALLDVSDTEVSYLSLGRNVYLDWCDRYVSASFKGAPVVCHYCRKSGHLKKDCPSRPPLICFKCHQHGHIRRRCTAKELSTSEALDAYIRDTAQRRKPVPSTPNVPAGKPVPSAADRSHQPLPAAPVGGSMQTAAAPVPAANSENSQQDTPLNGGVQDSEHEDADVVLDEVTKQIEKEDEVMQEDEVRQAPLPAFRPQGSSNSKFAPVSIASQMVIDSNTTNPPSDSLQKEFASYLSSPTLNFDILCIQELTAYHRQSSLTPQQIQSFKYLFPKATDYIVNKHCGIFCFNRNINLVNHIYQPDGRFIIATATAAATDTIICHIANVYAPASATENTVFLNQLPEDEPFAAISSSDPWLFMGDLNDKHLINSFRPLSSTSARPSPGHTPAIQFTAWLSSGFTNQFPRGATTFYRPGTARSTLDFLFSSFTLDPHVTNRCQHFLPQAWCDHDCLSVDLLPPRQDMGPGTWRFNPLHLDSDYFCQLLVSSVMAFYSRSVVDTPSSWESLKILIQTIDREYGKSSNKYRKDQIHSLQSHRQMELDTTASSAPTSATTTIQALESALDAQIQLESQQYILRSATRWKEQGERNNKYFYRVIKDRARQQSIQGIRNETTNVISTKPDEILKDARLYYQDLYSADPVDPTAISTLFASIPESCQLLPSHRDSLTADITVDELGLVLTHAPKSKSPGLDGIPFEVYCLLFEKVPAFQKHLVSLFNDALHLAIMPTSWKLTKLVLLFKKGDPLLLKNWRPLSLINADAKLFTKILANRLNKFLHLLINPYQTGFMRHRLISDNGWVHQALMDHLKKAHPEAPFVSVMLDQEKAYDRISPVYLSQVLHKLNFPLPFITAIDQLFFQTNISMSINGWLGCPFPQKRGLRQGDPLSPLLFNLAFEPLLRYILSSRALPGIRLPFVSLPYTHRALPRSPTVRNSFSDRPLKILSYADDLAVLLSDPNEWDQLLKVMDLYGRASNARVNVDKTVVVSLSGAPHEGWKSLLRQASNTIEWHDAHSTQAVRYLGYPLHSTPQQLDDFLKQIYMKIQRHAAFLNGRHLSIRGASLVANSKLLSRIWHLLRVVPVPEQWLTSVRRLVSQFVLPFARAPSWETICRPKALGGLGLIDLKSQQLALHMIYIQRILRPASAAHQQMDFTTPFLLDLLSHHTGLNNVLPLFLFPSMYATNTLSIHTGKMPLLHHILKVIKALPPLAMSFSWHCQWFLDIPLRCALQSTVSSSVDVAAIPLKWLVSDLLHVSTRNRDCLSLRSKGKISKAPALQRISDDLKEKRLAWHPTIKSKITSPLSVTPDLLPASWNSSAGMSPYYATLWLPKLPGWAIDTGRPKKFPVSIVPGRILLLFTFDRTYRTFGRSTGRLCGL